jgi:hypothetical protein
VIAPPYVPAQYMDVNKIIAESGSKVIVKGNINAPPVVGPKPGRTPKINPNKVPNNKTNNSFELNKGAIIKIKLSILIIVKISDYSRRES